MSLFAAGAPVKRVAVGLGSSVADAKRVMLGMGDRAVEVWSASPYGTLVLNHAFPPTVGYRLEWESSPWVNRCYTTSVWYTVESDGSVSCNAGTERPLNAYHQNVALGSSSQWASAVVRAVPTGASGAMGVTVRGTATATVAVRMNAAGVDIRSGTTAGTGAGTIHASASWSALPANGLSVGDVIGMTAKPVAGTSNTEFVAYVGNTPVMSWVGAPSTDGQFAGMAINGVTSGRLSDFKAGVF